MLFGGPIYYSSGGMRDFIKGSNSLNDLFDFLRNNKRDSEILENGDNWELEPIEIQWWHIYNIESERIECKSEKDAYGNWNKEPEDVKVIKDLVT